MSSLGTNLIQVIKDKEFQTVTKDLTEVVIDSNIAEGLLKDVPLLSTIIGTFNTVTNIKDKLFLKKILTFLYELKSISENKIEEQINKIEEDLKYRTKVGEKLLFIIDKCEDTDKASLTGLLFKSFLEKKIDYDQFITGTNIIEKTPLPDLMFFIENDVEELELDNGGSEFVSYGLMEIRVTKPNIKVGDEKYYGDKYIPSDNEILADRLEITDFEIVASISWIGQILRENLCKE